MGATTIWPLARTARGIGASLHRRQMSSALIVISLVRAQQIAKMPLAEDNDMVKAITSDRADEPLRISILPWRRGRDRPIPNAHRPNALDEAGRRKHGPDHEPRIAAPARQPNASVNCCAIHSAVGCAVTPNHRSSRRACSRIRNPYNSRNEIVGTTNKSIEAMPSA